MDELPFVILRSLKQLTFMARFIVHVHMLQYTYTVYLQMHPNKYFCLSSDLYQPFFFNISVLLETNFYSEFGNESYWHEGKIIL